MDFSYDWVDYMQVRAKDTRDSRRWRGDDYTGGGLMEVRLRSTDPNIYNAIQHDSLYYYS